MNAVPAAGGRATAAAIDALLAAGLRAEAAELLDRYGLALLRAGHGPRIEAWEDRLGRDRATPAALLLRARALAERNAPGAFDLLLGARAAAIGQNDRYTALHAAAAALLDLFTVWSDFSPLPDLLAGAGAALAPDTRHPDPTTELECLTGLLAGWLLQQTDDPRLPALADRIYALAMDAEVDAGVRLAAGGVLLGHSQTDGDMDRGEAMIAVLDNLARTDRDAAIPPGWRLVWEYEAALYLLLSRDPDLASCRQRIDAHAAGLPADADPCFRFGAARLAYELARATGNLAGAGAALAQARRWMNPALPAQPIGLAFMETKLALLQGRFRQARQSGTACVERALEVGVPEVILRVYRQYLVQAHLYSGDYAAARGQVAILMQDAQGRHRLSYEVTSGVIGAAEAFAAPAGAGRDAAVDACLAAVERSGSFRVFAAGRALGAEVMAHALTRNLHAATARKVIAMMQFAPPPDLPEAWPWAVRLRLLGGAGVEIDDVPLAGRTRAQQRPLDLLHAIALDVGGAGAEDGAAATPVDARRLMLQLWPDADADAQTAFDVALSRLRKLLGHDGLVTLADGRLQLDRQRIWCDVWTFGRLLDTLEPRSPGAVARVLALYRGPLFGDIGEAAVPAWAAAPRERLRRRFLDAIARCGAQAESDRDWAAAIDIYERGIAQDALAEGFYRGLMRCHLALGAPANALRAYRRCREMLGAVLDMPPSAETETLYRTIHA